MWPKPRATGFYFTRCSTPNFKKSALHPPARSLSLSLSLVLGGVGVVLLLCASMLALMRPAVQTASRSARRGRSLCWCEVLHLLSEHTFLSQNTADQLAQEDCFSVHLPLVGHVLILHSLPHPAAPCFHCPAGRGHHLRSAATGALILTLQLFVSSPRDTRQSGERHLSSTPEWIPACTASQNKVDHTSPGRVFLEEKGEVGGEREVT